MKVTAFASQVIVEVIPPGEALGTTLYVPEKVDPKKLQQGIIVSVGSMLDPKYDIKAGDKVFFVNGTELPIQGSNGRVVMAIESHAIRGVINEQ